MQQHKEATDRGEIVFIVGSSDVVRWREWTRRLVDQALRESGLESRIRAYSCDKEVGRGGYDQRYGMQDSLPRPSDERCRGVVCIIGERIGLPLRPDFSAQRIARLNEWTEPGHGYRLHHPWPEDPVERRELLDRGAYPLTGNVFEILDALGAGRPYWFALLSDEDVDVSRPGDDPLLNDGEYRTTSTKGMKSTDELVRWVSTEYWEQTKGVCNFMRALAKRDISRNASRNRSHLEVSLRKFLSEHVVRMERRVGNPYRHLEYFDIAHGGHFYGRKDFARQAVASIERRLDEGSRPAAVRITGPSGCGKSSVLRAGILRRLLDEDPARYACVAVRPDAFRDVSGAMMPVVGTLLDLIVEHADLTLSPTEVARVRHLGAEAPAAAAELLHDALDGDGPGTSRRLVLGLDQFEEILDVMAAGSGDDAWRPLLEVIDHATRGGRIGVVYTLESSRIETFERHHLPRAFVESAVHRLDDQGTTFLREIIQRPFARAGYGLDSDVVQGLIDNLQTLRDENDRKAHDAVLPLLAIKLTELFDRVDDHFEPRLSERLLDFEAGKGEGITMAELGERGIDLGFAKILKERVDRAIRRGHGERTLGQEELDRFLQCFVGVRGGRMQLKAAPLELPYAPDRTLARSFLRERLMVPVGTEQLRLVHEAVITHWKDARDWYVVRGPYLALEARVRAHAASWWEEREYFPQTPSARQIDEAAQVLQANRTSWAWSDATVAERDHPLREYCVELMRSSETPHARVERHCEGDGSHVLLAAMYGLTELLERFRGLDPTCLDRPNPHASLGVRPLHQAAWGQPRTVRYLLQAGVDPLVSTTDGWPAIESAIQRGNREVFDELLRAARSAVESQPVTTVEHALSCPDGRTLLHQCAYFDRAQMATMLVEVYDFDVRARDHHGNLPLHYAARSGASGVFEYLSGFDYPELQCDIGYAPLHDAASFGQANVVELHARRNDALLSSVTHAGYTALHLAAQGHHRGCVVALLPHIDPEARTSAGNSVLHCALSDADDAIDEDMCAIVEVLLADSRTDPNAKDARGRTPLALAKSSRRAQKLLLDHPRLDLGVPIDASGETPVVLAAQMRYWSVVEGFVRRRGVVTEPLDRRGTTLLHLAAHRGHPADLEARILDAATDGAMLMERDERGRSPLDIAVAQENWAVASRLLDIDGLELSPDRARSLLDLFLNRRPALVAQLVEIQPDVLHARDAMGWTVLHRAHAHRLGHWLEHLSRLPGLQEAAGSLVDRCGRRPAELDPDGSVGRSWLRGIVEHSECSAAARRALAEHWPAEPTRPLTPSTSLVRCTLSFYSEGVELVRARDPSWATQSPEAWFLVIDGKPHHLGGSSAPIHDANDTMLEDRRAIDLTPKTVLDYLRFFCFFVHGEEGRFLILESAQQPELPLEISTEDRKVLRRFAHPSWYCGEVDGEFLVSAVVCYGDAVFMADFKMSPGGLVEMIADRPLAMLSTSMSAEHPLPLSIPGS